MSNSAGASYVRSIRGPVLLVVLGALMAVDHQGLASFWRTWPALLVAMGVMILAERITHSRSLPAQGGGN